jgi:chitosanase
MKRAGRLLFVAVPLVAVAVYVAVPDQKGDDGPSDARAPPRRPRPPPVGRRPGLPEEEGAGPADRVERRELQPRLARPVRLRRGHRRRPGYTAGIIGFTTGTHDLLKLVELYTESHPDNALARYLPALRAVDGSDSHEGLDPGFTAAWKEEAQKDAFKRVQDSQRDRVYFDPAVRLAKRDGLGALGQFIYYDAMVMHGPGDPGFHGIRERAMAEADTPAEGGRAGYLDIFLDTRRATMKSEKRDTTRVDTAQRRFLYEGNLGLRTPLEWKVYGVTYKVD